MDPRASDSRIDREPPSAARLATTVAEMRARFPTLLPDDAECPAFRDIDHRVYARLAAVLATAPVFSSFPVETLLQEAGTLLERCLLGRDAKMELEVRFLDFWLDYLQFLVQDQVRREQFAAGELSVPATTSAAEFQMHDRNLAVADAVRKGTKTAADLRQRGAASYDDRVKLAAELAWLTAPNRIQAVRTTAADLARNTFVFDAQAAEVGHATADFAYNTHASLRTGAKARADFEAANVDFKRRMYEAEAATRQNRAALALVPGVGLNFGWRLQQVQKLFDEDFVDAYGRLKAAEKGLSSIFGVTAALPAATDDQALTSLVLWLRQRLTELAVLLERECRTVRVVSVDTLLAGGWAAALAAGVIEFRIDAATHFAGLKLVRLRSVQLFTRDTTPDRWSMDVQLPQNGIVRWADGTDHPLDQGSLPRLVFGDVGSRDPSYRHGRSEARVAANASPIGDDWTLTVADRSHLGSPRSNISGIDLVLELSALPG